MDEIDLLNSLPPDQLGILGEAIEAGVDYELQLERKNIMEVKVYTQKTCGQCRAVKMALDKKGIKYEVIDVNDDNRDEMKKNGIMHTPILEIDGKRYMAKPMMDIIKEL